MELQERVRVGSDHLYTMRELNHDTAGVIRAINESGKPALITRQGRFVAMITPLANRGVESAVLDAVIDAAENSQQLLGERTVGQLQTIQEAGDKVDLRLPEYPDRELG